MSDLLVVAGEASGDRAAAGVLAALAEPLGGAVPRAFGMGGAELAAAGTELVADLRETTALGFGEVAARGIAVGKALARVLHAAHARRPRAALLVDYTEFNARVAAALHGRGVRILWYGAPQIWAWRPARAVTLRPRIDRMAVILPFEEELWRARGVDAHYVGHPALEIARPDRRTARRALAMTDAAAGVAILPGSRAHEVRQLLPAMLAAFDDVRSDLASVDARVLVAPSLDARTRAWMERQAIPYGVPLVDGGSGRATPALLPAFDAALCASGTATLEAALAHAVPIVAYRVGRIAEAALRRWMTTPHVALPNVLLGRAAFTELVQRDVRADKLARALYDALDRRAELVRACDEVAAALGDRAHPSRAVARMLAPWLRAPAAAS